MINTSNQFTGKAGLTKVKGVILASLVMGAMALPLLSPSRSSAPTPPGLGLQLYAGLSITGTVGTIYSVRKPSRTRAIKLLALPRVSATADQSVSLGRQVRARRRGSGFTERRCLRRLPTWCSSRRAPSGWAARRTKWTESPSRDCGGTADGRFDQQGVLDGEISSDSTGVSGSNGNQPQRIPGGEQSCGWGLW